ncbi:DUF362 domain-containing protein [candidate division KSB1 bacterium]|nr:DUF362 domain-containing protein [candidate division KSB1 bacterium]
MSELNRRDFIAKTALAGCATASFTTAPVSVNAQDHPQLVVAKNSSPAELVKNAVEGLGGMGRFVKRGQSVLIKPNIGWNRIPDQAANTNPEAVAQVVKMCLNAGAKRVRVLDRTCAPAKSCYKNSGIEKLANEAGAEVRHVVESRFQEVKIPNGKLVKSWLFYKDALESDVLINMPIAKHHTISGITLGFKNFLGILGGERGKLHTDFMTKVVDINLAVKPALTIIDAYRILLRNGPSGGNLDDVAIKKTIIAGTDRVAVDAYAATLFDVELSQLEYLKIASEKGLGTLELDKVAIKEIDLSI